MRNHGITGPLFGVKVEELKKYEKAIKKDYQLALDLYETGGILSLMNDIAHIKTS